VACPVFWVADLQAQVPIQGWHPPLQQPCGVDPVFLKSRRQARLFPCLPVLAALWLPTKNNRYGPGTNNSILGLLGVCVPMISLEELVPRLSVPGLYRLALCGDDGYAAAAKADTVWAAVCAQYGLVRSRYDLKWLDTLARNIRQRAFSHVSPQLWVPGVRMQLHAYTLQTRTCGPQTNVTVWKGNTVYAVLTSDGHVAVFAHRERDGVVEYQCAELLTNYVEGLSAAGDAQPPQACKNDGTCRKAPLGKVVRL
jgi:hypothetical protein